MLVRFGRGTSLEEIFAFWANFFFGLFYEKYKSIPNFCATFLHGKSYNNFYKKWVGLHFGRFFHKLIWSPCFLVSGPKQFLSH
jgi:hypothetical protein